MLCPSSPAGLRSGMRGSSNVPNHSSQPIGFPASRDAYHDPTTTTTTNPCKSCPHPSDTVWKGDSMTSRCLSHAALSCGHYDKSAVAWAPFADWRSNQHPDQHLTEYDTCSSPSVSDDSDFSQSPQATIVNGSYDEFLDILLQMPEVFTNSQEQTLQNTAVNTFADTAVLLRQLDVIANSVSPSISYADSPTVLSAHQQRTWDEGENPFQSSQYTYSSAPSQVKEPAITFNNLLPQFHRARYEKEAEDGAKGLLKTETKEPIDIQIENMIEGSGDVNMTISAVTESGAKHHYIYPSCFGRGMPSSWKKDAEKRIVTTVLKKKDDYRKRLSFLGIKRNKLERIDLRSHSKKELGHFRVLFEAAVPSTTGSMFLATACTPPIRILCPSTATKLRKMSEGERRSS